MSVDTVLCC